MKTVLQIQGAYYLGTGVLAFVSRRAFEAVTGPKREWWLVQTVGAVVSVIGASLISAARKDRVTPELRAVAAGSALSLAGIDVVYVAKGRIAPTYLADAAVQVALVAAAVQANRRSIVQEPPASRTLSNPTRS